MCLCFLLVVVGCGRKAVPSITSEVRDSIVVREVPRLVEVKVPGETVTVKEYIECDPVTNKPKQKDIKANTGRAHVAVAVRSDGLLTASGGCDSLTAVIQQMDKEIFRLRHEKREEVRVVTQYKTRDIDVFCRWFTAIVLLIIILYTIVKFKALLP
jgi:hypothetical protein